MAVENIVGEMVGDMMENINLIRSTVLDLILGLMAGDMLENG